VQPGWSPTCLAEQGASRWAGRTVPFAELVAVADGDRLEAAARIEGLSHGPAGIQISLVLRVTALRTETVRLDGACYRAERVAGAGEFSAGVGGWDDRGRKPGGRICLYWGVNRINWCQASSTPCGGMETMRRRAMRQI